MSGTGTKHNMAQIGRVLKEGQWTPKYSPTHPMVQWDRMDSGIWGPQMGQWTSMYSPNCPMVQWDGKDSCGVCV